MNWIVAKTKWILLVSGVLTSATLFATVMPGEAVDLLFGRTLDGAFTRLMVTLWGAHAGVMGAMLIHAAFAPHARAFTLTVVGSSKLIFLGATLALGRRYLDENVAFVIALDVVMVALFATFLFLGRRARTPRQSVSQPVSAAAPRVDVAARPPAAAAPGRAATPARTAATARTGSRPGASTW